MWLILILCRKITSDPSSRSGLPPSGSWQDLKDHMREAGDVCYADVFRDGTGVVEFVRKEDMTYAVRKLDNTKFRSHEVGFSSSRFDQHWRHRVAFWMPWDRR